MYHGAELSRLGGCVATKLDSESATGPRPERPR
jgi:hypothetical protein